MESLITQNLRALFELAKEDQNQDYWELIELWIFNQQEELKRIWGVGNSKKNNEERLKIVLNEVFPDFIKDPITDTFVRPCTNLRVRSLIIKQLADILSKEFIMYEKS